MASGLLDAAGGKGSVEPIKQAQNAPEGHNGAGTGRIVSLSEGLSQSQAVQAVKKTLGREHSGFGPHLSDAASRPALIHAVNVQSKQRGRTKVQILSKQWQSALVVVGYFSRQKDNAFSRNLKRFLPQAKAYCAASKPICT